MNVNEWSNEFPSEEGVYWFYGDPFHGQLSCDFENSSIEPNLYYVQVKQISNGLIAVASGQFMSSHKFNKEQRRSGYVGYWKKFEQIQLPNDILNLFKMELPNDNLNLFDKENC